MAIQDEILSKRLRYRVRALGDLLGETMKKQLGEEFLEKVEEIRLLAKTRRQNGSSINSLLSALKGLDDDELVNITRAFNQFLNLTNIAEQAEATALRSAPFPEQSHLTELFVRLKSSDLPEEKIVDTIKNVVCDLVLTAHPTEITRRTLIQKYNRIANQLEKVDEDKILRPQDRMELERLVAEVWYTDEIRTEKPSPQDEAIWGYAVIEQSFWEAIPLVWEGLDILLQEQTGKKLPLTSTPIKISTWMGGDRDGNPNVTAIVTEEVIRLARWMAADLYLRDMDELLAQLSMSACTQALKEYIGVDSDEPYRILLRSLRERLTSTRDWAETTDKPHKDLILYREDLFEPLRLCYESLEQCGMGIIAEGLLKKTLIRISTFGVTLVELDIRQVASRHEEILDHLTRHLELGSYVSWSEKARQDFLLEELGSKRPLIPQGWKPEGQVAETLATFHQIASGRAEGIGSYIISMAKNPSDVLAVLLLLKKCGLERALSIVPLFETLDDLNNSAWTLERLLHIPWYKNYIKGHQQIMIGYSDSAKDAGQMAAAWAQYRAQEDLVAICEKYDTRLTLFHGRGGTVSRGGGPAREAILSQPPGSVNGSMRVTEQGEMIRFKYGSPPLALNNLDLILSATIEASLLPPPHPHENWRLAMEQLADVAKTEYRNLVNHSEDFLKYFNQSSPERELAQLALGSRPQRRSNTNKNTSIDDLRAIPWVFAWTQKRLMLPAWLGTDEAFRQYLSSQDKRVIKEMLAEWPFFRTQLDMLEMVLSKADAEIASYYDEVLVAEELRPMGEELIQRMNNLISMLNVTKGQDSLLEGAPEIRRSLDLRHPYTDPLHFLQIELMARSRKFPEKTTNETQKALLVTIAGIAASMRNTG